MKKGFVLSAILAGAIGFSFTGCLNPPQPAQVITESQMKQKLKSTGSAAHNFPDEKIVYAPAAGFDSWYSKELPSALLGGSVIGGIAHGYLFEKEGEKFLYLPYRAQEATYTEENLIRYKFENKWKVKNILNGGSYQKENAKHIIDRLPSYRLSKILVKDVEYSLPDESFDFFVKVANDTTIDDVKFLIEMVKYPQVLEPFTPHIEKFVGGRIIAGIFSMGATELALATNPEEEDTNAFIQDQLKRAAKKFIVMANIPKKAIKNEDLSQIPDSLLQKNNVGEIVEKPLSFRLVHHVNVSDLPLGCRGGFFDEELKIKSSDVGRSNGKCALKSGQVWLSKTKEAANDKLKQN